MAAQTTPRRIPTPEGLEDLVAEQEKLGRSVMFIQYGRNVRVTITKGDRRRRPPQPVTSPKN